MLVKRFQLYLVKFSHFHYITKACCNMTLSSLLSGLFAFFIAKFYGN